MKTTIKVPNDILIFNELFKQANKELYLVGGCVRDHIMGIEPHDFDLVTNANPDEIIEILSDYRCDLQGKQFGVIRSFTDSCNEGYEIATYRKDISKGRDNKSIGNKVEIDNVSMLEDANRRDFTMNALYYDIDNQEIIDLVGGINDINNNVLRTVGEANQRFSEDRLRILRAIRFVSRFEMTISYKIHKALMTDHRLKNISPIDDISQERIIDELFKMNDYCRKNNKINAWNDYVYLLSEYDLFNEMFYNILILDKTKPLTIKQINYLLPITLFFIFEDLKPTNKQLVEDFKLPSYLANEIIFLIKFHVDYGNDDSVFDLKKLQLRYNIGDELLISFIDLYDYDLKFLNKFIKFKFSVSSEELMNKGFIGKELGNEIKRLELLKFKEL